MNLDKLAKVLVNYSVGVTPGKTVCIVCEPSAEQAALAAYAEVLRAGGHAFIERRLDGADEIFFENATGDQLDHTNDFHLWYRSNVDCLIFFRSPYNTSNLSGFDPALVARKQASTKPLMEITSKRAADGDLRWVLTEIAGNANAQNAGMSRVQFDQLISNAGMLHLDDTVGFWTQFSAWQQTVVDSLNDGRAEAHIVSARANLRLSVAGRTWINCDGKINFPDGEVYTGPVENSAVGWVKPLPVNYNGNVIEGAILTFKDGKVVKALADKGERFLHALLDTDDGSRFLGEWGIGTHPGITKPCMSTLLDEKMTKTIHVAVGNGYPQSGSVNHSSVHCDMIVPMREDGTITIDDKLIYEKGEFTIGDPSLKPSFA